MNYLVMDNNIAKFTNYKYIYKNILFQFRSKGIQVHFATRVCKTNNCILGNGYKKLVKSKSILVKYKLHLRFSDLINRGTLGFVHAVRWVIKLYNMSIENNWYKFTSFMHVIHNLLRGNLDASKWSSAEVLIRGSSEGDIIKEIQ